MFYFFLKKELRVWEKREKRSERTKYFDCAVHLVESQIILKCTQRRNKVT